MPDTKKPHLSPNQLDTFCKCPEQWRRIYIEGERRPPAIAMIRGTSVHRPQEVNFRQKIESHEDLPVADFKELAAETFEAELKGGYQLSPDEESIGRDKVLGAAKDTAVKMAEFHALVQAPDYQPELVEQPFRIALPGTHDLVGVIDLADDHGRVNDLKTAAKSKRQPDADDSVQLTTYAVGYKALTGKPAAALRLDVIVGPTKNGFSRQVLSTDRTTADFQALASRINVVTASINAGLFPPAPPGAWWCSSKWCGFHSSCPYVNSERRAAEGGGE